MGPQYGISLGLMVKDLGFRGIRDYNSTPPKGTIPPRLRTLLGLIKPYIVLISSLNPGGVPLGGGTIVIPC